MVAALQGKEILITREKSQSKVFAALIKEYGGVPVEIPLLTITCRNFEKEAHISNLDWIIFTSANGVHCFFKGLNGQILDDSIHIAVVGHKTEKALLQYGVAASFVPTVYNAEVMATEFLQQNTINGPILIVKGNKSRQVLQEAFVKNRVLFDELVTYETNTNRSAKGLLTSYFKQNSPDFIAFTSPSTVDGFMEMSREEHIKRAIQIPCLCIGTTTETHAEEAGFLQTLIPDQFTIEGMVDKMVRYIREKG